MEVQFSHVARRRVSIVGVVAVARLALLAPPEHNAPRDNLEHPGHGAEDGDGGDVDRPPPLLDTEDGHALEHVEHAEDDDGVPDGVVVQVPVDPVLILLVGSHEQREDLERGQGEERDADFPVCGVGDALGLVAQVEARGPAGDARAVAEQLAGDVEVEPRRVEGFECLEVPREEGASG